jgi:uncharacterized protein
VPDVILGMPARRDMRGAGRAMSPSAALIVIAREPVAGRVKTRLCPPCSPAEAATIAAAALADTLGTVRAVPARRHILALDGRPGDWLPEGFDIVPQPDGALAHRLADAFARVGGPAFLVGMDTPHLRRPLLAAALEALNRPDADAALGGAEDGGYWGIGLRRPDPAAFAGVPMSTPRTGRAQRARLRALGLRVRELPPLRDVDTFADALAVAELVPGSSFAAAVGDVAGT